MTHTFGPACRSRLAPAARYFCGRSKRGRGAEAEEWKKLTCSHCGTTEKGVRQSTFLWIPVLGLARQVWRQPARGGPAVCGPVCAVKPTSTLAPVTPPGPLACAREHAIGGCFATGDAMAAAIVALCHRLPKHSVSQVQTQPAKVCELRLAAPVPPSEGDCGSQQHNASTGDFPALPLLSLRIPGNETGPEQAYAYTQYQGKRACDMRTQKKVGSVIVVWHIRVRGLDCLNE